MKPRTKEQYTKLAIVFAAKLRERIGALALESAIAVGMCKPPKGFKCPPDWALKAAAVVSEEWANAFGTNRGPGAHADQVGLLVGMAKTFGGYLKEPSTSLRELEAKSPELAKIRSEVIQSLEPYLSMGSALQNVMAVATVTACESVQFAKGQLNGTSIVVDDTGELKEAHTSRVGVCVFVWLYWQELRILKTLNDFQEFLEAFDQEYGSRKNLEKICANIGLRFRGRGRPKNPTTQKSSVGIKVVVTGVKRRGENTRRRPTK